MIIGRSIHSVVCMFLLGGALAACSGGGSNDGGSGIAISAGGDASAVSVGGNNDGGSSSDGGTSDNTVVVVDGGSGSTTAGSVQTSTGSGTTASNTGSGTTAGSVQTSTGSGSTNAASGSLTITNTGSVQTSTGSVQTSTGSVSIIIDQGPIRITSDAVDRNILIAPGPTFAELMASSVAADAFGYVIDSPVGGLRYKSGEHYGITDSAGKYGYILGESVEFFIGDITIGVAIQPLQRLTPYELANSDAQTALNIARFLQTLDNDGDPDNGIHINDAVHTLAAGISVNFSSMVWQGAEDLNYTIVDGQRFAEQPQLELLIFELTSATEAGARDLVSAQTAYYHIASTLNELIHSLGSEAESLLASSTCTLDSQCKSTTLSSSDPGRCTSRDTRLVYSEVDADIPAFELLEEEREYLIDVKKKLESSAGPFARTWGSCSTSVTVTFPICGESNHCEITTSILRYSSPPSWQF